MAEDAHGVGEHVVQRVHQVLVHVRQPQEVLVHRSLVLELRLDLREVVLQLVEELPVHLWLHVGDCEKVVGGYTSDTFVVYFVFNV